MEPFDNRLCDLKLRPAIKRLHEEAGKCWRRAEAEVKERGNYARLLPAFVECQIKALNTYLEDIDKTTREVWLLDGNQLTPEFIRRVLVPRIVGAIASRRGSIQHELELRAGRTGEHNPAAQHYLVRQANKLGSELASRYEAEAIEVAKLLARDLTALNVRAATTPVSPETSASAVERRGAKPGSRADLWRDFHEKFQSLADEERREGAAQRDRFLRAYCTYEEHPEVLYEKGKPEQGPFCLLKCPETGLWTLGDGVNENFQARFRALAVRAGLALGCSTGTDAEDLWLHRLYLDLLENNSEQLFAASKEGGVILRVCVASATFCARLEKKTLETSPTAIERNDTPELAEKLKPRKRTENTPRQSPALTERRARTVSKLLRELRTVRPKMHNQGHYVKVKREHPSFLIFKVAQQDSDVREWIENVQDRRGVVGLAQEIAARHFKVSLSTIKTDWSHRRKPRRSPKERR